MAMKRCNIIPYVLVIWTITEFVWCDQGSYKDFSVSSTHVGITISCGENNKVAKDNISVTFPLMYKDENSGEYECVDLTGKTTGQKIFVKFRSCENCVEFDPVSISGLFLGDLIATIVLGVAVYFVSKQTHVINSQHKNFDRKHLISNKRHRSVPNEDYQELRHKGGRREIYHTLSDGNRGHPTD
ncbi:T-cell surface glycoprotein CD3 epsilon chain [Stigmatopora nigra]